MFSYYKNFLYIWSTLVIKKYIFYLFSLTIYVYIHTMFPKTTIHFQMTLIDYKKVRWDSQVRKQKFGLFTKKFIFLIVSRQIKLIKLYYNDVTAKRLNRKINNSFIFNSLRFEKNCVFNKNVNIFFQNLYFLLIKSTIYLWKWNIKMSYLLISRLF